REAIETIALAVFLVLVLQASISNYRVEGPSMDPQLHNFDRVLVNKAVYMQIDADHASRFIPGVDAENGEYWHPFGPPERGDVVVFRYPRDPSQNFVKRIIGLPGDTIRIDRGVVFVNGQPLDEPYIEHESHETLRERVVDPGMYYVMGDNRSHSQDSRDGWNVPRENIVGKVWVAYWPPDDITTLFINTAGALGALVPPVGR
ncbi:MAG: signal peptidase I, partial [Dehalococcoidia bacterium]